MRIVVALDAFKGSLSAPDACGLVAAVLARARPHWDIAVRPMADGGEGTVAAICAAGGGEFVTAPGVTGPLPGQRVDAGFGWLPRRGCAVVEMAHASGLPHLRPEQRDPMRTTTFGTGQVLLEALKRRPAKILLGLGGSATVDGGTGAARALGWRFLDEGGRDVPPGGEGLAHIHTILPPRAPVVLPPVEVLCDVRNPLCGPDGAAAVFGPQKGATPAMVPVLDAGLRNLAERIRLDLGVEVLSMPGGGAAGGFGAGAVAFLCARLVPGVAAVAEATGLDDALSRADWVVTGEGSFDAQSLQGKVVSGVLDLACPRGVRVAVLAGRVRLSPARWRQAGVAVAVASAADSVTDETALAEAGPRLEAAAQRMANEIAATSGEN